MLGVHERDGLGTTRATEGVGLYSQGSDQTERWSVSPQLGVPKVLKRNHMAIIGIPEERR